MTSLYSNKNYFYIHTDGMPAVIYYFMTGTWLCIMYLMYVIGRVKINLITIFIND